MTQDQTEKLDQLTQIIKESAEKIINHNYPEKELLFCLYQKGFEFLGNQSLQNIVDVGAFGLALAIRREQLKSGNK